MTTSQILLKKKKKFLYYLHLSKFLSSALTFLSLPYPQVSLPMTEFFFCKSFWTIVSFMSLITLTFDLISSVNICHGKILSLSRGPRQRSRQADRLLSGNGCMSNSKHTNTRPCTHTHTNKLVWWMSAHKYQTCLCTSHMGSLTRQ